MHALCIADLHIGLTTHGVTLPDGRNSRLVDVESVLQRVVAFAKEQHVDLIIIAGDVFHTNKPATDEQLVFWNILEDIREAKIRTRIIIGNHDYHASRPHALKLFKEVLESRSTLIRIYDETTWEEIDDVWFCFMPYKADKPKGITSNKRKILVCHSHLQGAVVGSEPFEIPGDHATKFSETGFDVIIAGHFHKPQLLSRKPLAFYPGSIQPVDFNERHDVKGAVILDTETLEYKCAGFRTRRLYQIEVDQHIIDDHHAVLVNDAIVKVNVTLPEHSIQSFNEAEIREKLLKWGAHSIASINLEVQKQHVVRNAEVNIDNDLKSNFIKYAKMKEYGDNVVRDGVDIINQCSH